MGSQRVISWIVSNDSSFLVELNNKEAKYMAVSTSDIESSLESSKIILYTGIFNLLVSPFFIF